MRPRVRLAWLIPAWAWVDGSLVSGRQGSDTHPAPTSVGPASGFAPEQEGNQRVRVEERLQGERWGGPGEGGREGGGEAWRGRVQKGAQTGHRTSGPS